MKSKEETRFQKYQLNGKWALVTGAAGLLGSEHCHALLEAGANVLMIDLDLDKLVVTERHFKSEFPNSFIKTSRTDITSEIAAAELVQELSTAGIEIEILINNAAINPT